MMRIPRIPICYTETLYQCRYLPACFVCMPVVAIHCPKGNPFSEIEHEMQWGKSDTTRNSSCSIMFSTTFNVISRKFGSLFGQCITMLGNLSPFRVQCVYCIALYCPVRVHVQPLPKFSRLNHYRRYCTLYSTARDLTAYRGFFYLFYFNIHTVCKIWNKIYFLSEILILMF